MANIYTASCKCGFQKSGIFLIIGGLSDNYKALAPHVGITYWSNESINARKKEYCKTEIGPSFYCKLILEGKATEGDLTYEQIADAPKEFFNFFILLPFIFLFIFTGIYIALKWILKGFKK